MKHGVRGQRAADIDAVAAQSCHRRRDDGLVFLAERAILAGMRVEAGDRKARRRNPEPRLHIRNHDASRLDDEIACELRDSVAQRQMNRDRHHGKFRRPQHHHGMRHRASRCCRELREELRVTRMRKSRTIKHAFGNRIGDHRAGASGDDVSDGVPDRRDGCRRAAVVGLSGVCRGRDAALHHRQRVGEHCGGLLGADIGDVDADTQRAGARDHKTAVANQIEWRKIAFAPLQPSSDCDVRSDARGLADRERQSLGRGGFCHGCDAAGQLTCRRAFRSWRPCGSPEGTPWTWLRIFDCRFYRAPHAWPACRPWSACGCKAPPSRYPVW